MRLNTKKYKSKLREPHYTKKKAMHNKGKKHRKTKKAMVIKKKKSAKSLFPYSLWTRLAPSTTPTAFSILSKESSLERTIF